MHEIHGRVVDAETGGVVVDAEVFVTYKAKSNWDAVPYSAISQWTSTDTEGRFHFKKGWECVSVLWPGGWLAQVPYFQVFHRKYGLARSDFYRAEDPRRIIPREEYLLRGITDAYLPDLRDLTIYVWESTDKEQETNQEEFYFSCVGLTAAACDRLHRVRACQVPGRMCPR